MKKSIIAVSSLTLSLVAGVALAQWNHESFPPFEIVDSDGDNKITTDEAKANPDLVDSLVKNFFGSAQQKDEGEPVDTHITKEEWDGTVNQ